MRLAVRSVLVLGVVVLAIALRAGCGANTDAEAPAGASEVSTVDLPAPPESGVPGDNLHGGALSAASAQLADDPRIAWLYAPCSRAGPFTADTSDPIAMLVNKLETGQRDPLRRAKIELAEYGAEALRAIGRKIDHYFTEPGMAPRLQNAVEVLARMDTPAVRPMLRRCLEHPSSGVRTQTVRAFKKHAQAADFEALLSVFPLCSTVGEQSEIVQALHQADSERMARLLGEWLAAEEHPDLCAIAAPLICASSRGASVDYFRAHYARGPLEVRAYLAACAASDGESEALGWLREELAQADIARRTIAANALWKAGLGAELGPTVASDPDPSLRALAASVISDLPGEEPRRWLRRGMADSDDAVRSICLGALVSEGDAAATDEVLAMLEGDRDELRLAVGALGTSLADDRSLAERVLKILVRLHDGMSERSLSERSTYLEAIARVPTREAAVYLLAQAQLGQLGVAGPGDEPDESVQVVRGMPLHRWLARQAGNSAEGRAYLAERWSEEPLPLHRVDLIEAVCFEPGAKARELCFAVLVDERSTPAEKVYAVDRLVNIGPARRVAAFVKRVNLKTLDKRAQHAIRCLLWKWYG